MEINICRQEVTTKQGIKCDRRLLKTKKAIIGALIELLTTKNISDITVTELTSRAKINRKTFYLHYEKIEDVISDFSDDLFVFSQRILLDAVKQTSGNADIKALFSSINRAVNDNLEFFRIFVRSGAYHIFVSDTMRKKYMNVLHVTLAKYFGNTTLSPYVIEYVVSGVSAIYNKWLCTELPTVSLDTLSESTCNLVMATLGHIEVLANDK